MRIFHLSFYCLLFLITFGLQTAMGQEKVHISQIQFEGNKRTKEKTMLRELTFVVGDSILISDLSNVVEENRQRLQNTNLFSKVESNIMDWTADNRVDIQFTLREQWYLTGYTIFDLADRNFNVWWVEQNRRLDRVDYGFRIKHDNLTGNADEITAALTLGYTRRAELEYNIPAINKDRTLGLHTKIFFSRKREINFTTLANKFEFYSDDDFQLRNLIGELGLVYRKKLDSYHGLQLEFHQNQSSDTLSRFLNPDFFLADRSQQRFLTLAYTFTIDKRKQRPYAKQGWYFETVLRKHGLGIFKDLDALTLSTTIAKYFELSPKVSLETVGKVHFFFNRDQQPYYNSRALGLKPDFLSGYELYVVDGMDFSYLKTSLRYQFVDWEWDFKMIKLFQKMRLFPMPLQVYLTINNDVGYVNDPYYADLNPLSNTFLWGGGIGIDIVAYYDKIFQIQYSFNHLLESGIFLHFKHRF